MYHSKYDSKNHRNLIFIQSILLKILGLLPWTVCTPVKYHKKRRVNFEDYKCKFSYFGSVYNIILIILIVSWIIYVMVNEEFDNTHNDSFLTDSVQATIYHLTALLACGILLIYVINQKLVISAFNQLKNVDETLLKCRAYRSKNYNRIHVMFIVNFIMLICYEAFYLYHYPLHSVIIRDLPTVINCCVIIQYIMIIDVINKRFEMINLATSKFGSDKKTEFVLQPISEANLSILGELVPYEIEDLKCAHGKLCDICQDVGNFFGLSMLFAIIRYGLKMITTLYFFILLSVNVHEFDHRIHVHDIMWLIWIIPKFIVLTTYVTKTEKEVINI